jgi:putative membrane protein
MRFLRVFIGALLLLILIVFAVANKDAVTVSVDPLPFVIELPLYLLVFAVFFVGLIFGVVIGRLNAWSSSRRRAEAEKQRQARQALQTAKPATTATDSAQLPPPSPLV